MVLFRMSRSLFTGAEEHKESGIILIDRASHVSQASIKIEMVLISKLT